MSGSNFDFLVRSHPELAQLARRAELYCHDDPNAAVGKIRLFGERVAKETAARLGLEPGAYNSQNQLVLALAAEGFVRPDLKQVFDSVRLLGNQAVHEHGCTRGDAVHALKMALQLGGWFYRSWEKPGFRTGKLVVPEPPGDVEAALREQIAKLHEEITAQREESVEAVEKANLAEEQKNAAEALALAHKGDLEAALALAEEAETQKVLLAAKLARLKDRARDATEDQHDDDVRRVFEAGAAVELDEADTRKIVDQQLRAAGWEADSENLRHGKGTRPQKGRHLAIAEWPTARGPADYVLFRGLEALAVVEAKRKHKRVAGVLDQAKRYAQAFQDDEFLATGAPWGKLKVPFLFATNGRPYLRQIQEESGIHFQDARRTTNHPRALTGWYTPDGLDALLTTDAQTADQKLASTPVELAELRPYQREAVRAAEGAIANGRREVLLAMATGTGKTRTAVALVYRLVRADRFRRVLFVVDRTILGEQAHLAFGDVTLENLQTFTQIYDTKALGDTRPDADTRLHFATIQSLVKRVVYGEEKERPAVDAYDAIVVDECHRGYTLDREMSDAEISFKDEADYISSYRRVLEHFDAVKIGLTATPALHTTEIFGPPAFHYSYPRAVVDGFLVDHEPPYNVTTRLARDGIHWEVGEDVVTYNYGSDQLDLFRTPDEIHLDVEEFNKTVRTENFNRTVCGELARRIDPEDRGKTLVFCVDDKHADLVVGLLKAAFAERYGELEDDAVRKITGSVDKPPEAVRRFKNERYPSVAVTVDLLTTGVDVPQIVNLVFLRRVKSRILYEQMMGRATRLCRNLYGPGEDKEVFKIYDAVGLYDALKRHTDMKPRVTNLKTTMNDLVHDLVALADDDARALVRDQLIVLLRRKRKHVERLAGDLFTAAAGMSVGELLEKLAGDPLPELVKYFRKHPDLGAFVDKHLPTEGQRIFVSEHEDEVVAVTQGYGKNGLPPADYLEEFTRFVRDRGNEIPALLVVTRRPRELTRQQLLDLKLALEGEGYGETQLRSAWTALKNEDVAASIIGFIRQRALGDPLRPYDQRVDDAVRRLLRRGEWTPQQRDWIQRIAKQMKRETVVDRAALDRGAFRADGGFRRLDRIFEGHLENVLAELHEEVWKETA